MSYASGAVTAKCRAVFGQRLTAADYAQLAAKSSVPQVCDALKSLPRYSKTLSPANTQTIHRGQLEALLGRAAFDIFDKFRVFDYTESKGYFKYIVERMEIGQIISAIGAVRAGTADKYIAAMPMYLSRETKIDLPRLGKAANLTEIVALLEGTPHARVLREPLLNAVVTGELDIVECERLLVTDHYTRLLEAADKTFHGAQRKEYKRCVLRAVDMQNVVYAYRQARFGNRARPIVPFGFRLSDDVIEELVKEKDVSVIKERLARIGYRGGGDCRTVEQLTNGISLKYTEKTMRMTRFASVAYFELTESVYTEIKNISTVIEGVRYGLDGGEIMAMLVV